MIYTHQKMDSALMLIYDARLMEPHGPQLQLKVSIKESTLCDTELYTV